MTDFTNHEVELDLLPKYQKVTFLPIHKNYWNILIINLLITIILMLSVTAVAFVFISTFDDVGMGVYGTILIIELLFIGFLIWSNRLAFKKRGYAVREKDLLYRSGILSTTTTIVPFNRIQHIAVNEGAFSRMYGLAAVEIFTAGGSSSDLSITGIEKEKAYQLKEFLMENITGKVNSKSEEPTNSESISEL